MKIIAISKFIKISKSAFICSSIILIFCYSAVAVGLIHDNNRVVGSRDVTSKKPDRNPNELGHATYGSGMKSRM